jgi:dynein heavy chain
LQRLRNYDKENIPAPILQKVKVILSDKKEFNVDKIMNSSKAAGGMAKWCVAIHKYAEALKVIKPKEAKVAEMQEKFKYAVIEVEEKQKVVTLMKM